MSEILDEAHIKIYQTTGFYPPAMTAAEFRDRICALARKGMASVSEKQRSCPRCGYPENADEDLGPSGCNERMPRMT